MNVVFAQCMKSKDFYPKHGKDVYRKHDDVKRMSRVTDECECDESKLFSNLRRFIVSSR